jgi:hypothetical protein
MTYQIPPGAYPKHWTSPPDPPNERAVEVDLNILSLTVRYEASMDPYDWDQVEEKTKEKLNEVVNLAKARGIVFDLLLDIDSIENWDVYPEHLPEEMEEIA